MPVQAPNQIFPGQLIPRDSNLSNQLAAYTIYILMLCIVIVSCSVGGCVSYRFIGICRAYEHLRTCVIISSVKYVYSSVFAFRAATEEQQTMIFPTINATDRPTKMAAIVLMVCVWMAVYVAGQSTATNARCPEICSCLGTLVDCSKRGLTKVPDGLPVWTQFL